MTGKTWPLGVVCCMLFSVAVWAGPSRDAEREHLKRNILRALHSYDVNQQEKYIIDLNFSTLHAMAAYSELLLWAQAQGRESEQGKDLNGIVRDAFEAHIQHSGAGVALSEWEGEGQPIGLAYELGLPQYIKRPEPGAADGLRWRTDQEKREVSPISIGQSLRAKSLFLLLSAASEKREFSRLVMQSLMEEFDLVADKLFLLDELGRVRNGAYVPSRLGVSQEGVWKVSDPTSRLMSQFSLLQGLISLNEWLSSDRAAQLFGNKPVAGKRLTEWSALARSTMESVYSTLLKNHFHADSGSFVKTFKPGKKSAKVVDLMDTGMVVSTLNSLRKTLPPNDKLVKSATDHLVSQGKFVREKIIGSEDDLPKGFHVVTGQAMPRLLASLDGPIMAMTLLLNTYEVTRDPVDLEVAEKIYASMQKVFWSEEVGLYRSALGYTVSAYDGYLFGAMLAWMRLMDKHLASLADFKQQGALLINKVLKAGGLLQCEGPRGGETLPLEHFTGDVLSQLLDKLIKLEDAERAASTAEFYRSVVDQDGDRLPGCRFGGGLAGTAPVLIMQTSVKTPFPVEEGEVKTMPPGGKL